MRTLQAQDSKACFPKRYRPIAIVGDASKEKDTVGKRRAFALGCIESQFDRCGARVICDVGIDSECAGIRKLGPSLIAIEQDRSVQSHSVHGTGIEGDSSTPDGECRAIERERSCKITALPTHRDSSDAGRAVVGLVGIAGLVEDRRVGGGAVPWR